MPPGWVFIVSASVHRHQFPYCRRHFVTEQGLELNDWRGMKSYRPLPAQGRRANLSFCAVPCAGWDAAGTNKAGSAAGVADSIAGSGRSLKTLAPESDSAIIIYSTGAARGPD